MRFSVRAAVAVAMLVGFYVLLLGLLVGIVVGEAVLLWNRPIGGLVGLTLAVPAFFALVAAMITIERVEREALPGVPVTAHDQPRLWDLVNRIAAEARAVVYSVIAEYTKLYMKVSSAVCRRQELAADAVSARVVGSATAASALRELRVLSAAWEVFVERHLDVAVEAGYLPTGVHDGFADLLACADLAEFLEEVRSAADVEERGEYDSHPPASERVAAIEALAAEPARGWGTGPATALLVEPGRVLDASVAGPVARVSWAELGHLVMRARTVVAAERLLRAASRVAGRPATVTTVLDALDAGKLTELAPEGLRPGSGSSGSRVRREFARGFVGEDLTGLVALAHVDLGLARWRRDWIGDVEYVGDPLEEQVDAAVADGGSTAALRAALAAAGVAPDYRPAA